MARFLQYACYRYRIDPQRDLLDVTTGTSFTVRLKRTLIGGGHDIIAFRGIGA